MQKIPILIDCDTGIDDAMALVLGLSDPTLDIKAITTVAGNVACEQTTRNTLNVVHFLGRSDIPVARGAEKPLERKLMKASGVHGVSGLRGWNFPVNYKENLSSLTAWDLLRNILMDSSEPLTIVSLGPMTNIAILLEKYPEVKTHIKKVVFMGTSYHCGNPTALATFNVLVDPEAFRKVLFSGISFMACPLEVTRTMTITSAEMEQINNMNSEVSRFVIAILSHYGLSAMGKEEIIQHDASEETISVNRITKSKEEGVTLHDPATLFSVIDPTAISTKKYYCDVETKGELTTGFTLIDKNDYYKKSDSEKNLTLIEHLDRSRFASRLIANIQRY
ncbi:MAG: nucleoside hydrolase [Sphaerochaetaceae bacterium]|nr:nucleoside hydrolase [Spirochaetales bacterium]MDY5500582.1 nucleoside hydrolase [Sphaerochaetaceae bacterium]